MTAELLKNEMDAPTLTAEDRCDGCAAQAYVRVVMPTSELLFCAHHWNRPGTPELLRASAITITDETWRLS